MRGGGELAHLNRRAVAFALMTAVTICCYSLVDGIGARTAGNAHSYALWLFVIDGAFITGFALVMRGTAAIPAMAVYWKSGLIGGVLSLVAYWIVIWAMTVAPIAHGGGAARDQRAVRRGDRGRVPEGAAARPHRRGVMIVGGRCMIVLPGLASESRLRLPIPKAACRPPSDERYDATALPFGTGSAAASRSRRRLSRNSPATSRIG